MLAKLEVFVKSLGGWGRGVRVCKYEDGLSPKDWPPWTTWHHGSEHINKREL